MPQVPKYGDLQVAPQPIPGVRVSEQVPLEAVGGGAAAEGAFRAASGLAHQAQGFAEQAAEQAMQTAYFEAASKLASEEARLSLEGEKAQGRDALQSADKHVGDFDKFADEIIRPVQSPVLRARLNREIASRHISLNTHLQRHAAREIERYDNLAFQGFVDSDANLAVVRDGDRGKIDNVRAAFAARAQKKGLPPETAKAEADKMVGKIHAEVLQKKLRLGDAYGAEKYYSENKDEILGQDQGVFEAAITEARNNAEASAFASAITSGGLAIPYSEQLAQIEKAPEEIRPLVSKMVKQIHVEQTAAQKETEDAVISEVYTYVEKGGDPSVLAAQNPILWQSMSPQDRNLMYAKYDRMVKSKANMDKTKTDYGVFMDLMTRIRVEPGTVSDADLYRALPKLSEKDGNYAAKALASARGALDKKPEDMKEYERNNHDEDMVFDLARMSEYGGLKVHDDDGIMREDTSRAREVKENIGKLRTEVTDALIAETKMTGKELSYEERRRVAQGVLAKNMQKVVFKGSSWLPFSSDREVSIGTVTTDMLEAGTVVIPDKDLGGLMSIVDTSESLKYEYPGINASNAADKIGDRIERAYIELLKIRGDGNVGYDAAYRRLLPILEGKQ